MKKSFLNKEPKSFHLYLSMKSCFRMLDSKRQLFKRRVTSRLATPLGDPRGVPKCFRKCFSKRYHSVHSKKRLQDLFGLNKFEYSVIILIIALKHNRSILKVNIDFAKMSDFEMDWPFLMDPLELFGESSSEVLDGNGLLSIELDQIPNDDNVTELISNDTPHEIAEAEMAELQPPAIEAYIAPDINVGQDHHNIMHMQENLQHSHLLTPPTSPVHQEQYLAPIVPPALLDPVDACAPAVAPAAPLDAFALPAPAVNPVLHLQEEPRYIITLVQDSNASTSSSAAAPLSPEEARRDLQRRNNDASRKYRQNKKNKYKIQVEELDLLMEENKKLEVRMKCMVNLCKLMRGAYVEMLRSGGGVKRPAEDQNSSGSKKMKID